MRSNTARRLKGLLGVALIVGTLGVGMAGPAAATEEIPTTTGADRLHLQTGEAFSDIADAGGHRANVETLAGLGILDGTECAPDQFCPNKPIERWVIAVWLVRAVDRTEPPAPESPRFADVEADQWWVPYVERLAELGITRGCATEPDRFCPTDPVTRQQMAPFLVRAFGLEPQPSNRFADVEEGNSQVAAINGLAAAGITAGCARNPDRYCPGRDTTRAQMATFLARALGIATPPPPKETTSLAEDTTPPPGEFVAISAGWEHSCGIRSDRTLACWGHNWEDQADAPDGEFTAVAAGRFHSCAIRTDQSAVCWGQRGHGLLDPPEGAFSAIASGGDHSCAIRADHTVACWGSNAAGQSDPPQGSFTALSAGEMHTCGLLSDQTVTCWGDDAQGQSSPPQGSFTAVSAGNWHTCGLTSDATIACWGGNWAGQDQVPPTRFTAVGAGWEHSCGIASDGTIACWGHDESGRTYPPEGAFTAVSLGDRHSCGLRVDATVACWGLNPEDRSVPLNAEFTSLSAGASQACGVRSDQIVVCWGRQWGVTTPPGGTFTSVSTGREFSCGIRPDQIVVCWGANSVGQANPPEEKFLLVATGQDHACGLRADQRITCWGDNSHGQADAPEGTFVAVAAGGWHSCGILSDQTVACWGVNGNGQSNPPPGEFTELSAGASHICGLRSDGAAVCWGANWDGQSNPPSGQFQAINAGVDHSCGVRSDQTIVCWGSNNKGESQPPDGTFISVSAGHAFSCGLEAGGQVSCWGRSLVIAAPDGVEHPGVPTTEVGGTSGQDAPSTGNGADRPNPQACRPAGPVGFPPPAWAAPSVGTLRVAVLFVDFPDAQAAHTTQQEADLGLPFTEKYLMDMSNGKLDIEFVPLHKWLRTEFDYQFYAEHGSAGVKREAIRLADPDFDFTGFHALMLIRPSTHFGDGLAERSTWTEEGTIPTTTQINAFPLDQPRELYPWPMVGAHELTHNIGPVDLYSFDPTLRDNPRPPEGKRWVEAQIGLMGLWAFFPAPEEDPRLAHDWIHPDGVRTTSHDFYLQAPEMLAWIRWQLGWLDSSQIRCLTDEAEATITLYPIAFPGANPAMLAIPVSETELIVIESRRRIGYDAGEDYEAPDGARTTFPVLADEGVLVYTVDASLGNGQRPIRIVSYAGNSYGANKPLHFNESPFLREGQSITIGEYTITVQSTYYDSDVITITKNPNPDPEQPAG